MTMETTAAIERNSLGEIVIPVYLKGISSVRVRLDKNPQLFLDAFEHIAGREGLILRVLDHYLRALPPEHVETLIPVLRALAERQPQRIVDGEQSR